MFGSKKAKFEKLVQSGKTEKLLKYINGKDGPNRLAAIAALGKGTDDIARNNLITILYGDSREYRLAAARALQEMNAPQTREFLTRYLEQESDAEIVAVVKATLANLKH